MLPHLATALTACVALATLVQVGCAARLAAPIVRERLRRGRAR